MELTEYQAAQAAIVLAALSQIQPLSNYYSGLQTLKSWTDFLAVAFPIVAKARRESARKAYEFFHSEHERVYGYRDDLVFSDDEYEFDWFVDDMERNRRKFTDPNANREKAHTRILMGLARTVENGGRDAMTYAVEKAQDDFEEALDEEAIDDQTLKQKVEQLLEEDPPPKRKKRGGVSAVKGWARVPTGAETCGWCLMLCSRGPVYKDARSAGLDLADRHALEDYDAGQPVSNEDMDEWHEGCDCKVVPVFDTRSWPGKETADNALELWKEATRLADEELERNPDKKSFVNGRWIKTTRNREAINQMRRLTGG